MMNPKKIKVITIMNGDRGKDRDAIEAWIKETKLYKHCQEMKKEITLHKWYESEKAGYDIGWDRAQVDWMVRVGSKRPKPPSSH